MTSIGNTTRPAYVYDLESDTWIPIGVGPHSHDNYIDKVLVDAKGDIFVGSAPDTVARLGVGSDGTFLKADSSSATGLVWEVLDAGSISVSETSPAEPEEGDLWFNSTNATTYIYYDDFWIELSPTVPGPKGEPGVVASASEPSDTDVLWLDTDDTSDAVIIPPGGDTGQVLAKTTGDDYDTQWATLPQPSGNVIINGAFDFWQRGTSFTNPGGLAFVSDRWTQTQNSTGQSFSFTRQQFLPAELSAMGYGDATSYIRYSRTVAGSGGTFNVLYQPIEDVRTLAGQTVTVSYWAKSATSSQLGVRSVQVFGSGGSPLVITPFKTLSSITPTWTRYVHTATIPSISGKTIGENSILRLDFQFENNATSQVDIWGVQLEAGSVATPFKRNANSIQGELAACQRYYHQVLTGGLIFRYYNYGSSSLTVSGQYQLPVTMRANPTVTLTLDISDGGVLSPSDSFCTNARDVFFIRNSVPSTAFLDLRTVIADAELFT
jgi:hypothetical protein